MRPKDKDGLAVIAALREAEAAIGAAMQCAGRTMDTIDTLRVRVDELERVAELKRKGERRVKVAPTSWDGKGYLSEQTGGWREDRRDKERRKGE